MSEVTPYETFQRELMAEFEWYCFEVDPAPENLKNMVAAIPTPVLQNYFNTVYSEYFVEKTRAIGVILRTEERNSFAKWFAENFGKRVKCKRMT